MKTTSYLEITKYKPKDDPWGSQTIITEKVTTTEFIFGLHKHNRSIETVMEQATKPYLGES